MPVEYAAFDADGTLWREDLGEAFLLHLQDLGVVPKDCFSRVKALEAKDPQAAYILTVQCMAGHLVEEIAELARAFGNSWVTSRLRPEVWELVENCRNTNKRLVVVSATGEIVLKQLDILEDFEVHGIRVKFEDGVLTREILQPVTYSQGKVKLLEEVFGRPPSMAAGDSPGDLPMLEYAEIGVWVGPEGVELPPGIVTLTGL